LKSRRSGWERLWERVAELVLPRADDFYNQHSPGSQRNLQQYDAFPMAALNKFAAALETGLVPRNSRWHQLSTGEEELDDDDEVKAFLEEFSNILWKTRYSPRSNFASQAHEKIISLGAFGTGGMRIEPGRFGGIRYISHHLSELFIEPNNDGIIDTVHREFTMTARNAVREFGEDTPQKILDKMNADKPYEPFDFIHAVCPNEDWEPGRLDMQPFTGCYVMIGEGAREVIRKEEYFEQPYIVSRYNVSPREHYGRSPAIQLLPDISMLNEMKRTMIDAANLGLDPPTLLHENISEFDLVPGAQNYGTLDDNGREMVKRYDFGSQPAIGRELMVDTRNQIDDGFLGVYFRVLLENPQMTATQAMLIAQQQGQMTAPAVGRLQSEWLDPMLRRESGILYRQGQHPQMPQKLMDWMQETGEMLQIRYETPLTRAAMAADAVGIARSFETMTPFAQIDPSIFDGFDTRKVAEVVMDVNGVPQKVRKSVEQQEAEGEQQEAAAQASALLDAAPVAAQTAKTLAEAQQLTGSTPQPVVMP
jgi:hypothetical protein